MYRFQPPKASASNESTVETRYNNESAKAQSVPAATKKNATASAVVEETSKTSMLESRLMEGGLKGLQNLGNTVRKPVQSIYVFVQMQC